MNFAAENYDDLVFKAIAGRLQAALTADVDTAALRVFWPLVEFEPTSRETFLKFNLIAQDSFVRTICGEGKGHNRNVGVIQIDCYVPKGRGLGVTNTSIGLVALAGKVRKIFSRQSFGGVLCDASSPANTLIEGAWARAIIRTRYECEEYVTA